MQLVCKCHGVSGACTTKTCWQHLSDFRSVGRFLKGSYARAIDVDFHNGALQQTTRRQRRDRSDLIRKTDLVYLQTSPDYCMANGSYATLGRQCVRSAASKGKGKEGRRHRTPERKSCLRLCKDCGLKVTDRVIEVTSTCQCKFRWCCEVVCQQCRQTVELSTCSL
jgi:wingless-type MMTV integration site family protein 8